MMSGKLPTLGLQKLEVFGNKSYNIIVSVHDVINKILSPDSNYIVDLVLWTKSGNSSISVREVIITSILLGFYSDALGSSLLI